MNDKITKAKRVFDQEFEMLEEYNFSGGVRGKYYQVYQNNNLQPLQGVQFVVNNQGKKLGVLIDLSQYQNLLNNVLAQFDSTHVF